MACALQKEPGNIQFLLEGIRNMKLQSLASVLLLAAWTPALAARQPTPATPMTPSFGETMEVNVVNVDVYVTDKQGKRVSGLKKGDFEVLEDGKRVEIINFDALQDGVEAGAGGVAPQALAPTAAAQAPRSPDDAWSLVVFIDDSNLQAAHRARALQQLGEFLTRQLRPGDRVMLATFDMGLHVRVPFTSDFTALDRGLAEVSKLTAHGEEHGRDRRQAIDTIMTIQKDSLTDPTDPVPCPQNIVTPAHAYAGARRQEVLRSLNALTVLVNSLSGVPGRKAVLHVSDGIPLTPGEEVFQYLAEICGGHGNGGIGTSASLSSSNTGRDTRLGEGGVTSGGYSDDDANQVFDVAALKADSYRGVSQAPMDAQTYSVAKNLEALAAHANANRVTLYTLQASGVQGTDASDASFGPGERLQQFPSIGTLLRASLRDSLQLLADETGGRAILNANQFLPDLSRMREDFSTLYSLGIAPAHNGDGREHKLIVKVKRPDLRLRYRQSYRDKPVLERSVDRTLAALYYGIEENPLEVAVEIGDQSPAAGGQYSVPIRLRIPIFKLAILNQGEAYQGKLRLLVAIRDEEGGTSPVHQVEVPLNIPRREVLNAMGQYYVYNLTLNMKPGLQHVAVAVRDDLGATTSYLSRPVAVGAPGTAAMANP
jgi:VWFA-related protein